MLRAVSNETLPASVVDSSASFTVQTAATDDAMVDAPGCTGRFCTCSLDCLQLIVDLPDVVVPSSPFITTGSGSNNWRTSLSNVASSTWLATGWQTSINTQWMSAMGPIAPPTARSMIEAYHAVLAVTAAACTQANVTVYFQGVVSLFWNGLSVSYGVFVFQFSLLA
jgi:hypothetical protein